MPCLNARGLQSISFHLVSEAIIASEASFLVCSMRGFSIYIYIYIYVYIFQAVRRAVNVLNVSTCI